MNFRGLVFILSCLALAGLWSGGPLQDCRAVDARLSTSKALMSCPSAEGGPAGIDRLSVFEPSPSVLPRRGQSQNPGRPGAVRPNRNQSGDLDHFDSIDGWDQNPLSFQDDQPALAEAADWPVISGSKLGVVIRSRPGERPLTAVDRFHKFLVWLQSAWPLADLAGTLLDGEGNLFA